MLEKVEPDRECVNAIRVEKEVNFSITALISYTLEKTRQYCFTVNILLRPRHEHNPRSGND